MTWFAGIMYNRLDNNEQMRRNQIESTNEHRITVPLNICDLPEQLTKEVDTHIRLFAVTMLISDSPDSGAIPCSGTLISIKGQKGILTARHVCEELFKHKFLLIMIGPVPHVVEVDTLKYISPEVQTQCDKISSKIPDLAFVRLPDPSINHLESTSKAFFSIDKRLDKDSMEFATNSVGYFVIFGAPDKMVDYQKQKIISFCYSTYIHDYFEHDGWDYQIMGLDLDSNPEIPDDFVGISGGGIWKIKFIVSEDKTKFAVENFSRDVVIVGVNFYQTDLPGRQIIGHGPKSIYRALFNFIE